MPQEPDPNSVLEEIIRKDKRYALEAYTFVFEALGFTLKKIGERRHVSGQELLEGIRQYAIRQFGLLAKMVFNSWGVYKTGDFGEIVFNMVEAGLMGRNKQDTKDDFKDIYNFDDAFSSDKTETTEESKTID